MFNVKQFFKLKLLCALVLKSLTQIIGKYVKRLKESAKISSKNPPKHSDLFFIVEKLQSTFNFYIGAVVYGYSLEKHIRDKLYENPESQTVEVILELRAGHKRYCPVFRLVQIQSF